ncbi:MAG: hypothetical protein NTW26_10540 [bacterium]|nr:hypothetical protein [bacterium]
MRFQRRATLRSKHGSVTHIILLGAALAVIIWLIFFLKDSSLFGGDGEGGETGRTHVVRGSGLDIDENLINYFDEGIQLLRPDSNWEFAYGTGLRHDEADAFSSVAWLDASEICRLTLYDADRPVARVRVGKLQLQESRTTNSLAHQSFENIMLYALNPDHPYNVDTWEPTTTLNSDELQGTYYVIKVIHSKNTQADIRIVAFYVKDKWVYALMGEVSYEEYDLYRDKLRSIFGHFVFI